MPAAAAAPLVGGRTGMRAAQTRRRQLDYLDLHIQIGESSDGDGSEGGRERLYPVTARLPNGEDVNAKIAVSSSLLGENGTEAAAAGVDAGTGRSVAGAQPEEPGGVRA